MSVLTYEEALRTLQARGRFGIRLGLGRTRALLRELGDPHQAFRGALVGGTNGKGSVLALVASALHEAGLRAGTTPKPHLVSYRERLQIDGRLVAPDDFAGLTQEVLAAADRIPHRLGPPTEFEILTVVAYAWFAAQRVDLAVVEVGLGGRLDATHVWDGGVAAISNVDFDHMDRLGGTIAAIAREKAAIIERGDLAVTGAGGDGLAVIRRRARRLGVPLMEVAAAPLLDWNRDSIVVDLARLGSTRVGLRGRHQAVNVAVADAVLDALAAAGIADADSGARRRGYGNVRWPGRLELLTVSGSAIEMRGSGDGGPAGPATSEVLLDGAHNPAGAAVLAGALDDLRPYLIGGADRTPPPVTLILASMADKDVAGVLSALARSPIAREARVICTEVHVPRALPADRLARGWSAVVPGSRPVVVKPVAAALERALAEAPGPIVVAGSLYLVGEVRGLLETDPAGRDPGSGQAGRPSMTVMAAGATR